MVLLNHESYVEVYDPERPAAVAPPIYSGSLAEAAVNLVPGQYTAEVLNIGDQAPFIKAQVVFKVSAASVEPVVVSLDITRDTDADPMFWAEHDLRNYMRRVGQSGIDAEGGRITVLTPAMMNRLARFVQAVSRAWEVGCSE